MYKGKTCDSGDFDQILEIINKENGHIVFASANKYHMFIIYEVLGVK